MAERELQRGRSIGGRTWVDVVGDCGPEALLALCERLNVSQGVGKILAARRLLDAGEAERFLNPVESQLHPPGLMLGMNEAVQRIVSAVERNQKIVVFGDNDVDGTASTTILYSYLKRLGARATYYLPHRILDGYGFTPATLQKLHAGGTDLVVATDHGSTDLQGPPRLKELGIDLIIADHHQLGAQKPEPAILLNPHQPGCSYPFKGLSATGVVFKLVCGLDRHLESMDYWSQQGLCRTPPAYYLDLVALATVADMSPLVGENRILVKLGLEAINSHPRPGLAGLMRECHIRGPVTPNAITFKLAPKINALGRIGDPRVGVQLLVSHSYAEARRIARYMVQLNRERQELEHSALDSALSLAEAQADRPVMVLVGGDWHPGVVGSIASRLSFQTGKPTIVLTLSNAPQVVGSARGGAFGVNILALLAACSPLLIRYGGHPAACGLALDPANLTEFTRRIYEAVAENPALCAGADNRPLEIESWLEADALTHSFVEELAILSPFGHCNPEPVLAVRGVTLGNPTVFNQRHLRFSLLCPNGQAFDAMAWEHSAWSVSPDTPYDIAFMPQPGESGARTQVKVLDLIQVE
jgi:single-stranded-DNA-specific exonuclease